MGPEDRFWAKQMLLNLLEGSSCKPPDPRAPRAMAELGWPEFIAPLKEILPEMIGDMAAGVARALGAMKSD